MRLRSGLFTRKKEAQPELQGQELLPLPPLSQHYSDEFFGGELGDATLKDVPRLVLKGVAYLDEDAEARSLTGTQKKAALVACLQSLCPSEVLDELLPPLIDLVVQLAHAAAALEAGPEADTQQQKSWWPRCWRS